MEIQGEVSVLADYLSQLEQAIQQGPGKITNQEQVLGQIDSTLSGFEIRY